MYGMYIHIFSILLIIFYVLPVDQSTQNPVQMLPDVKTMLSGEVAIFLESHESLVRQYPDSTAGFRNVRNYCHSLGKIFKVVRQSQGDYFL